MSGRWMEHFHVGSIEHHRCRCIPTIIILNTTSHYLVADLMMKRPTCNTTEVAFAFPPNNSLHRGRSSMKLCFVGTILAMLVASTVSFAFTTVPRSTQRNSRSYDTNHHPVSRGGETRVGNMLLFGQSPTSSCVLQRLDLSDTFSRWRFMQKLLDAEVEAADVNEILFRVLNAFVDNPELRPKRRPNDDDDDESSVSPPLTAQIRATIEDTLLRQNEHGVGVVWALQDPECAPGRENVLEALETLLPDPVEDENAYKGTWDLVIELHGRESTKIREQEGSLEWKARCLVARILIYYDFVTDGVIEVPFS